MEPYGPCIGTKSIFCCYVTGRICGIDMRAVLLVLLLVLLVEFVKNGYKN